MRCSEVFKDKRVFPILDERRHVHGRKVIKVCIQFNRRNGYGRPRLVIHCIKRCIRNSRYPCIRYPHLEPGVRRIFEVIAFGDRVCFIPYKRVDYLLIVHGQFCIILIIYNTQEFYCLFPVPVYLFDIIIYAVFLVLIKKFILRGVYPCKRCKCITVIRKLCRKKFRIHDIQFGRIFRRLYLYARPGCLMDESGVSVLGDLLPVFRYRD